MNDYFTVLDLPSNATDEQIRTQYRQLVRIYHPDRFSNASDKSYAERKLKEINEAYYGLLAPERTGKGANRRLTESQQLFPLSSATPGSVMILLSVLFVGVFLGRVDYEQLTSDDPAQADSSFFERFIEPWTRGSDDAAVSAPLHNWMSFSVFENYENVLYVVGEDGQRKMNLPVPGREPAWSPSRNQLAFLSAERDGTQIYTALTDVAVAPQGRSRNGEQQDSNLVRITQDNDLKRSLTWSPDGSKLAYIAQSDEDDTPALKLVRLDTNEVSLLTTSRLGSAQSAVWLDNKNLLVNMRQTDSALSSGAGQGRSNLQNRSQESEEQILLIPLDGEAISPFTNFASRDPSVAPGGQQVAVASDEGIFSILRTGNELTQLTTNAAWRPVWSPNGRQIAYLSLDSQQASTGDDGESRLPEATLWIMNANGQEQGQLTDVATLAFAWSVDGTELAFVTGNMDTQPPTLYLWTVTPGETPKLIAEISEPHVSWGRGL